ncbi:MAG: NAD-dependent epimerase/dehydratase family protein [Candidatus Brocadia sp. AMX2]|uniref:Nucleoside-diphosphate-sugar epimerases n=1 Tax=Candidatus Brocadia sinica JPN1 TaxID=1197129 RepID=A0ABQ0JZK5_9BACT|nr:MULTISPECIES: GDP-mannose 4,6-dehydratase [Brocadia]KXK27211.1 MAG: UDP-glucuronate 5'-epimerase [Candidatus Brocadia sinica]MBC6933817.1 NAD-dependent epimerase/dehydratase family protein [Candidatus Brocadia sp.]MBL1170537.1 NAD-dependent epimerase/dehydratase family protein [Candidatus Brocadia sp. AMX1]NOG42062.1 NAD-dependent epimerase/dehydratase family protein [Planctomycetota bacterium]KAA0242430.1 MAG: NAD-dependent epimerase/dehydratase family protein [Candidatus Brocadia sp. AMX2
MAILVTGGAGFIGSHLVEKLLLLGEQVVVIDNFNDFYPPAYKRENISAVVRNPWLTLYETDICNTASCKEVFEKHRVEKIVHLAAYAGVRPSIERPLLYEEVNCRGTLNLLELSRIYKVKQFIFGSSSSVYGNNKKIPFSEDDPVNEPISPYAATKRGGELYCYNYHHLYEIPIACLRFFTVYGPRQRPDLAIRKFTEIIDHDQQIPMYGDGTTQRDYTFFSDIIDGVVSTLKKQFDFEIINLGNSTPIQLARLIELIEQELGKKAKIKRLPEQPGDVHRTYADIRKAERFLQYRPKVSIEQGIRLFVAWYKEHKK